MLTSFTHLLRSRVAGKYILKEVLRTGYDGLLFGAETLDDMLVLVHLAAAGSSASSSWRAIVAASAALPHRHLLRYVECGQTRINCRAYDYLITEPIEDRVEDVLNERSLTPEETDTILRAALSALGHLHQNGYAHGGIMPEAIVAASGEVKLMAATVRPIAAAEAGAKDSIAPDLRALGETATKLLTGQTGPKAVASLDFPFAEFVRATAVTGSCPIPTIAQLRDVLDRQPAAGAKRGRSETGRRRTLIFGAVLAVLVLSLLVFVSRWSASETTASSDESAPAPPLQTGIQAVSTPTPPRGSSGKVESQPRPAATRAPPAGSVQQPGSEQSKGAMGVVRLTAPAGPVQPQAIYAVVAATYAQYGAAAKRAAQLASRSKTLEPRVVPPEGQGKRYFVILGTAGSRKTAERLRSRARGEGIPQDTYVTRLQF